MAEIALMPPSSPGACDATCSSNIAQYILDEFWDDTMSAKPVSAASEGSELLSPVVNGGVESGLEPWYAVGDSNSLVAQSTAQAHAGMYSLMVFDRNATTDGAGLGLNGLMAGQTYQVSVWVRLNSGEDEASLRVVVMDDAPRVETLATVTANDSGWTRLTGTYVHQPQGEADVAVYLDGPAVGVIYYLDDLEVVAQ